MTLSVWSKINFRPDMPSPLDLTGRTILITGASSGLGKFACSYLSRLGARIAATGRDEARLAETMSELSGEGHSSFVRDLTPVDDLPSWLRTVVQTTGPLHGLVHSAGLVLTAPLKILTAEKLREVQTINVDAAVMLAKGFRQKGVAAQPTSMVFMSSVAGMRGEPALAAYSATKGALIALSRSLGRELARENIRVNCISAGFVRTAMSEKMIAQMPPDSLDKLVSAHPLGLGTAEDVANAMAFLLSDASRWITGSNLVVDGGYTS